MNSFDKMFQWFFNAFIFLLCVQLGMLLTLRFMFKSAEDKLKSHQAQTEMKCSDFIGEQSYWDLQPGLHNVNQVCQGETCPDSYWYQSRIEQKTDLHVIAVKSPQPRYRDEEGNDLGGMVQVQIESSAKPQRLALVSQSLLQWDLKVADDSQLEEVFIIGPELVWIQGLPENVKLTYFDQDQICAFPLAWEESQNPDNEFRRLFMALKNYAGLEMTSFQGQKVAGRLNLPFKSEINHRGLAQAAEEVNVASLSPSATKDLLALGIQWSRNEQKLSAQSFQFMQKGVRRRVYVPAKTQAAFFHEKKHKLYLIQNYQFGSWDWKSETFHPIHLPLSQPALRWPTLMAADPQSGDLFIYNEERGGEIFRFSPSSDRWEVWAHGVGYGFLTLSYQANQDKLLAVKWQNQKVSGVVQVGKMGSVRREEPLRKEISFLKNLWKADLITDQAEFWLKLSHPARPGGELYPLAQLAEFIER